jgi:hypothetical protein
MAIRSKTGRKRKRFRYENVPRDGNAPAVVLRGGTASPSARSRQRFRHAGNAHLRKTQRHSVKSTTEISAILRGNDA